MPNRIIKESVWASESLSRCSIPAQGFFIRLFPMPDDHGCFDARASILRARLFPLNYEKVKEKDIDGWLNELGKVDCIRLWIHEGIRYGYFPSWGKHQQVRSLHNRKTPAPPPKISEPTRSENKGDSNCDQPPAADALNLNLFPNPNPVVYVLPADAFEALWAKYPSRIGRSDAETRFNKTVKTESDLANINTALSNYKAHLAANDWKRPKNGGTWFNEWQEWVQYEEPKREPIQNSGNHKHKLQGGPTFVPKQR